MTDAHDNRNGSSRTGTPEDALTVQFARPGAVLLQRASLRPPQEDDVVLRVHHSAISSGTEKLLYTGRMPWFPGLAWPLIPGYEAVGECIAAGPRSGRAVGDWLFAPGGRCHDDAADLFGAASSALVTPGARTVRVPREIGAQGALLALAGTARHALRGGPAVAPDLVVGHGVLGRLLVRVAEALGAPRPSIWERDPSRHADPGHGLAIDPAADTRRDYGWVVDASGDPRVLDVLMPHLRRGATVTLAGFYADPVQFAFAPAFTREPLIRIAAEWSPGDPDDIAAWVADGRLSLDGLITHRRRAEEAAPAYEQAFTDSACLKMVLDWRDPTPMTEIAHA